jgi:hypothetical protein
MSSTIIDIICVISLLLLYINNYKHLLKIYNSVRVSNELGAGHPKSASFSVVIVTLSSLIIAVILAILVLVLRHVISYVFTSGTTVSDAVSELTPFLAISIVLNGIQPVLSGKNFVLLNFGNIGASLFTFFGNDFLALVISNVVYSVSAPVSVWPLERNISVPVRFGVPFRVYRKYLYIYIYKISNYR